MTRKTLRSRDYEWDDETQTFVHKDVLREKKLREERNRRKLDEEE